MVAEIAVLKHCKYAVKWNGEGAILAGAGFLVNVFFWLIFKVIIEDNGKQTISQEDVRRKSSGDNVVSLHLYVLAPWLVPVLHAPSRAP